MLVGPCWPADFSGVVGQMGVGGGDGAQGSRSVPVKGTKMASLCRLMVCIGSSVLLVAAGCSTGGDATSSSAPSSRCGSAEQAGPTAARDEISPLVVTGVAPDPIPVRGTDGKYHVAYELAVLNAAPRATTLIKVETLTDDAVQRVLTTLQGDELVTRTLRVGSYPREPSPVTSIPGGQTALLLLDDVYDDRGAIPPTVTHRVEAGFASPAADQREVAGVYPDQVSQVGGSICHSSREPLVIAPPLQGDSWVALNACCTVSPHRSAMLPIAGRINGAERFAVDWVRFDLSAQPLVDVQTGVVATFRGDPTRNEDYLAYNQPFAGRRGRHRGLRCVRCAGPAPARVPDRAAPGPVRR
jgi:hypothetical protein